MAAVWAFARSELRQRRRSLLAVALLVALVGTVVLTAASGTRRTASSYDRFADRTLSRDARVQVDDPELVEQVLSAVESLDVVEGSARYSIYPVYPDPELVADDELDLAVLAAADDGLFREVERPHLLAGRLPDPGSAHEVVLNEIAAKQTGLVPGDEVELATFEPGALEIVFSGGEFPGFNGPAITVEVVGVTRGADELQGSNLQAGPIALATEAFFQRYRHEIDGLGVGLAIRLQGGQADIPAVRQAARAAGGPEGELFVSGADDEFADSVRDGTSVLTMALLAFTIVAGTAGALALGGTISRQVVASSHVGPTLDALGLTRSQRAMALAAAPASAIAAGAVLAMAGSVAASPLVPIGLARRVDLDAGTVHVDGPVLAAGLIALIGAGSAWALASAWLQVRSASSSTPARPSVAVGAASRAGLGPVAVTGLRHAFEGGRGTASLPVRSAVVAAVVGVGGIVGAAVVVTSLANLVDHPQRYGWSWSAEPDHFADPVETAESLAADDRIEAVAISKNASVELEGHELQGMAVETFKGDLQAVIRDGRAPSADYEVALGARTAEALGVEIADTVSATIASGDDTVELQVVGLAVFRPVDNPNPGDGVLLTSDGFESVRRSNGFQSVLVRYPDGADLDEYETLLGESHPVGFSIYSYPRVPGNVVNLDQTSGVIAALGAFFGLLGLAGVAHALTVSIRRRRHDLAVLRALGMLRRQTRRVVTWQASSLAVLGVLVGVPLGVIAGRTAWDLMVGELGVIDHMTLPVVALVLLTPLALAAINGVATWPARAASRIRPSLALRAE